MTKWRKLFAVIFSLFDWISRKRCDLWFYVKHFLRWLKYKNFDKEKYVWSVKNNLEYWFISNHKALRHFDYQWKMSQFYLQKKMQIFVSFSTFFLQNFKFRKKPDVQGDKCLFIKKWNDQSSGTVAALKTNCSFNISKWNLFVFFAWKCHKEKFFFLVCVFILQGKLLRKMKIWCEKVC